MADKDYKFIILSNTLDPCGPICKENLDVVRLRFDFSSYLDTGETIDLIQFPTVAVVPPEPEPEPEPEQGGGSWNQDYPVDYGTVTVVDTLPPPVVPVDTYPLTIVSEAITNMGLQADIMVNAGTPGFTYIVSTVIVGATTRRRKQVDTFVFIEQPVNPQMVGPGQLDPDITPPIVISGSVALPMGWDGLVILENSGNIANIVVTLPPNPVIGQAVEFIDALGKDGLYPVTFHGDSGVPVDGDLVVSFVSSIAYEALRWVWMGTNWHITNQRFGYFGAFP